MFQKKVLITGGLGFIGSNLAKKCVELGAEVTIFDNMLEGSGANLANIESFKDKITLIFGDIRNFTEISQVVREKDIIFNCAAQTSHPRSMENPLLDIDINCRGHMTLLEACRQNNPDVKLVFTGSRTQVGSTKQKISENLQQNPSDMFGAGMMASEIYSTMYNFVYNLKTCFLRLTNVYGPRAAIHSPKLGVLNFFIGQALQDKEITIFGKGEQLRDILYVDDVVSALILCSQSEKTNGQVYVVGSGKGLPLIEIAKEIINSAGLGEISYVEWQEDRKNIEVGDVVIDSSKLERDIGWTPKTSIKEGMRKAIDFYKNQLNKYTEMEQDKSQSKKKILVTGGLGHIGSKLIREYSKRQDIELIRVLDNFLVQRYSSLFNLPTEKKIEFIEGDVRNFSDCEKATEDIDVVIHLAAITDAPSTINNKEETFAVNLEGTRNMLKASASANVKKFLFPSTTSVYGEATGIVDETFLDLKPASPYAESKLAAEKEVLEAHKSSGLNTNVLRMGTIFGISTGMRFHTAVNKFCFLAAMSKPLTVWDSALNSKRPYLDLDDDISAFQFIEENGKPGELYNVLTNNFEMSEIINSIKKVLPETRVEITKSPLLNQKPYHVSDERIRKLGFKPKGNIDKAIRETISLFKAIDNSNL